MGGDFFKIAQRFVLFELWSFPSASFVRFSDVIFIRKKLFIAKQKHYPRALLGRSKTKI